MVIFMRESAEGKCLPGAVQAPPCSLLSAVLSLALPHQEPAPSWCCVCAGWGQHPSLGEPLQKQELKMHKEPSWFAGIYLRAAVCGGLHSGTWIVCGLGLNFSGASHLLPAGVLVPRCAFSLAPICTRFMDRYYIDLTQ